MIGKIADYATNQARRVSIAASQLYWARKFGALGPNAQIDWPLDVSFPKNIRIGKNFRMRAHGRLLSVSSEPGSPPGILVIGDDVHIEGFCSIAAAVHIELESHVLCGANVTIRDHDHGFLPVDLPPFNRPLTCAPVRIRRFVWIGQNVVILKGVTIGRNAVVGASAVVTRSVPDFAVVAGVPAKQIGWSDGRPPSA